MASKNQQYIDQFLPLAIEQQRKYGIPVSVTLAQGIIESANGQSRLAIEGNNATYNNDNDDNGFRLSSIRSENCETKRANPIPRCLRSATDAETKMRGRGGRVGGAIRLKSAGRLKTI